MLRCVKEPCVTDGRRRGQSENHTMAGEMESRPGGWSLTMTVNLLRVISWLLGVSICSFVFLETLQLKNDLTTAVCIFKPTHHYRFTRAVKSTQKHKQDKPTEPGRCDGEKTTSKAKKNYILKYS